MNFITIHETGNTSRGAGARNHANYLKGDAAAGLPVSWHYTTDDREIYQHLPENEDAFHAGDGGGNGNRQSIGIEICVNSDGDFQKAIDRTVELVAEICRRRSIPIENIRQHNSWSGKNCPQNIRAGRPHTWEVFIDKVRANLTPAPTQPAEPARTVTLDILGKVQDVRGFIENGETFVRLTEYSAALGFAATWDGDRRLPVIRKEGDATAPTVAAVTDDEKRLLQIITHWEARGESEKGQILVVNVIRNRVAAAGFPDTINDVVYAPNAFTPTKRADFDEAQPNARTIAAVDKALSGEDYSQGATFFHSISGIRQAEAEGRKVWHEQAADEGRLIRLFDEGNHRFYKGVQ